MRMKISTRLVVTLALLTGMLAAVVGLALWHMHAMRRAADDVSDRWLSSVEHVNRMGTALSDFQTTTYRLLLNVDETRQASVEQALTDVRQRFDDQRKAYAMLISDDEERRLHHDFEVHLGRYLDVHRRVIDLASQNQHERATHVLDTEVLPQMMAARDKLDRLVARSGQGARDAAALSDASYQTASTVMLVALGSALLIAVMAGAWIVRSITTPMNRAVRAAERVAAGDLGERIEVPGHDEAAQVLLALERMQSSLSNVVGHVRANAEHVARASAEIASANQDLSDRTEAQASALQQTAATMDELGTTVRSNAHHAEEAHRMAQDASRVARQGGAVVQDVVRTMQNIEDSSRRITDIIGVIDGIACQTNLLALNAAVEAARAGDQGRGFAAVAAEVRTLAKRSAEAAREVKLLIDLSVQQVGQGSLLVDRAGRTMDEVVGSICRVSDVVAEIRTASAEQSAGVQQVGHAVGQIDQATQRNAALVEQGVTSAHNLREQARQLVGAVAAFKVKAPILAGVLPDDNTARFSPRSELGWGSGRDRRVPSSRPGRAPDGPRTPPPATQC